MHPRSRIALLLLPVLLPACDDPGNVPVPTERRSGLVEHRELAREHLETSVEERLAADQQLLVDPMLPEGGEQTRYVLVSGALAGTPVTHEALVADPATSGRIVARVLLGGQDSDRLAIFDAITTGSYTVCVSASAPIAPEQAAFMARAEAAFEGASGGDLTPEKLQAAIAEAERETGYEPRRVDWSGRPLRCKFFEVTTDPASRIVELE